MSTPVPNYDDPESRQSLIVWANIVFNSIAFLAVCLRVYSRWGILKKMYTEDWLIIGAMVLAIAQAAGMCMAAKYGMGLHMIDIQDENMPKIVLWGFIFGMIYNPVLMLTRTAILLFCLRLFPQPVFRLPCYIALFYVNASGLAVTLCTFFACDPMAAAWAPFDYPEARCISMAELAIANALMNTLADVVLFVLPIPLLLKVRLPGGQKLGVLIVFGLGIIVVVASTIRLKLVWDTSHSLEGLWDSGISAAFSQVEVAVGIICACLPATRHVLGRVFPKVFGAPPPMIEFDSAQRGPYIQAASNAYGQAESAIFSARVAEEARSVEQSKASQSEEYILENIELVNEDASDGGDFKNVTSFSLTVSRGTQQ